MSIELVNISADLALALILVREIAPYYECRSLPISLAHGCPCVCVCVCVCASRQCYGEAFQGMASGMISARPAEEQVRPALPKCPPSAPSVSLPGSPLSPVWTPSGAAVCGVWQADVAGGADEVDRPAQRDDVPREAGRLSGHRPRLHDGQVSLNDDGDRYRRSFPRPLSPGTRAWRRRAL